MYYFYPVAFPVHRTLWRNVGRTLDKNINMEKVSEVFFSEHGLTSTSASHLADLAQEVIAGNEAKLKNMTFVTTKVDIVGSASESGKTMRVC